MTTDPLIIYFVIGAFAATVFALVMALFRQPIFTGYILAGALLGPHALGFLTDIAIVNQLGSIGVVLLLFFLGMEVSPQQLAANWRVAIVGTVLQVLLSVAFVWGVGYWFDWPLARTVLIGFVVSLSCTAVVADYLRSRGELGTRIGQHVLMILVAQDIFVIPMLIILGLLGGEGVEPSTLLRQACGTLGIFLLVFWSLRRGGFSLPGLERVKADKELQVFVALLLCFSLAFVTGILHLSTALGSFVAGILIGQTRDADWVRSQLDAVKVIFVALFFGSVGVLIDFHFLLENWNGILILVAIVFVGNTVINAAILRVLGDPPGECLYGGALLAHVGEFSFVLAAIGFNAAIVTDVGYQLTITVIAVSLVLGPAWVSLIRRIGNRLGLQHT